MLLAANQLPLTWNWTDLNHLCQIVFSLSFFHPIPFSTCQDPKNNITPCYFSSISLWRAIHDTIDVVWENNFVILAQNGKRGVGETERHIVCSLNPSTVVSSFQVFPPPGRMTERWFIIGLRQLQTGLVLPQSTCKAA